MLEELSPPKADCLGEPQQPAFLADESAIELVELLDEGLVRVLLRRTRLSSSMLSSRSLS